MASVGESGESVRLNIMPMMDVFSIIIVFLLMSYSTDPVVVDPKSGITLPMSQTISGLEEVPILSVSPTAILVNDLQVASVVGDDVAATDQSQGAIRRLYEELVKLKEANDELAKAQGKETKLGTITMEMDKEIKFRIARRIMLSAQQAEFVTFKFMVKRNSQ